MIYIRTDMNNQIATGHVMRCLAIADALRQLDENVIFLLADKEAVPLIESRGFNHIILNTQWDNMDDEIPVILSIIKTKKINKLLIDSYKVTKNYLSQLSEVTNTIYIDDLNAFDYPVNTIICYANYWNKFYARQKKSTKQLLLGTEYVPLRKGFWYCQSKQIKKEADRLLILSGGTDPYNFLERFLEEFDTKQFYSIDVICGRYNMRYNMLYERYKNTNVIIHKAVSYIEKYMKKTDLAISAGGTSLYELCAVGTPTISYSFADNQLYNVKKFHEDNIISYAGDLRNDDIIKKMVEVIIKYKNDCQLRKDRSLKMQKLVDGKGSIRLARKLIDM